MIHVGKDFGHLYSNLVAKAGSATNELRALSSWVWKTCKDRVQKLSGPLSYCLTALMVKKLFLISSLNLSCCLSSLYPVRTSALLSC